MFAELKYTYICLFLCAKMYTDIIGKVVKLGVRRSSVNTLPLRQKMQTCFDIEVLMIRNQETELQYGFIRQRSAYTEARTDMRDVGSLNKEEQHCLSFYEG